MEKYKDVKISTMVRKLNSYLNEKEITDIAEREYPEVVEYEINQFLSQDGYPFQCECEDYGYALYVIPEHIVAVDLKERHTTSKGPVGKRKRSFRRIIKTGPGFRFKVSEMVERRRRGIYSYVDDTMYDQCGRVEKSSGDYGDSRGTVPLWSAGRSLILSSPDGEEGERPCGDPSGPWPEKRDLSESAGTGCL